MSGILPPEVQEFGVSLGARRPRRLSARRVKALVRIGQAWSDVDGSTWTVAAIRYKDGHVRLERPRHGWTREPRFVTFAELGRHYRLVEEGAP